MKNQRQLARAMGSEPTITIGPKMQGLYRTAHQTLGMHPDEMMGGNWQGRDYGVKQLPFERILYEGTPAGQSVLMVAHLNIADQTPRRFRPELIQKRLRCTFHDADRIVQIMKALDASDEVVSDFVNDLRVRGLQFIEEKIQAYKRLAEALEDANAPHDDGDDDWIPRDIPVKGGDDTGYCPQAARHSNPEIMMIAREHKIYGLGEYEPTEAVYREPHVRFEDESPEEEREGFSEAWSYHAFGWESSLNGKEVDWLKSQPLPYRSIIRAIKECPSDEQLVALCKEIRTASWTAFNKALAASGMTKGEQNAARGLATGRFRETNNAKVLEFTLTHMVPMTRSQAGYAWAVYKIRKGQIAPKLTWDQVSKSSQAARLFDKVIATGTVKELKALGGNMMKFAAGKIGKCKIASSHWDLVWSAYHRHMKFLANPENQVKQAIYS